MLGYSLLVGLLWLISGWLLISGLRHLLGLWVDDIPRLNLGKPLTLPFSPVKVKRGGYLLPDLQRELIYALSEELNRYLLWVLPARFEDEHKGLPRLTRFGRALLEGEDLEHSPSYVQIIHIYVC